MKKCAHVTMLVLLVVSAAVPSYAGTIQSKGGSNFNFYQADGSSSFTCYGIVKNDDLVTSTINSQLDQIWASGQKRLGIGIWHQNWDQGGVTGCSGGARGFILPYTSTTYEPLGEPYRSNVKNLVKRIWEHGIGEILIAFLPAGGSDNDPTRWGSMCGGSMCLDHYAQNWGLIRDVHHAVTEALNESGYPLLVKYDLWDEGAPLSSEGVPADYIWQLWNDYNREFGKNDTTGVSFVSQYGTHDVGQRVAATLQIYDYTGYGRPYYYDVHLYDDPSLNLDIFNTALSAAGVSSGTGLVVGEAYYNDYAEASELWNYITDPAHPRTVFFLLQWPLMRGGPGPADVNVAPPSAFDAYVGWGT